MTIDTAGESEEYIHREELSRELDELENDIRSNWPEDTGVGAVELLNELRRRMPE